MRQDVSTALLTSARWSSLWTQTACRVPQLVFDLLVELGCKLVRVGRRRQAGMALADCEGLQKRKRPITTIGLIGLEICAAAAANSAALKLAPGSLCCLPISGGGAYLPMSSGLTVSLGMQSP